LVEASLQPLKQLLGGKARRPPANRHTRGLTATSASCVGGISIMPLDAQTYVLNQPLLSLGGDPWIEDNAGH
jgi:hypothetical protein